MVKKYIWYMNFKTLNPARPDLSGARFVRRNDEQNSGNGGRKRRPNKLE